MHTLDRPVAFRIRLSAITISPLVVSQPYLLQGSAVHQHHLFIPSLNKPSKGLQFSTHLSSYIMASNCLSSQLELSLGDTPLLNLTDILAERWEHEIGTDEDRDRLYECWRYTFKDCGDCHRSVARCGWCPLVSTKSHLPYGTRDSGVGFIVSFE